MTDDRLAELDRRFRRPGPPSTCSLGFDLVDSPSGRCSSPRPTGACPHDLRPRARGSPRAARRTFGPPCSARPTVAAAHPPARRVLRGHRSVRPRRRPAPGRSLRPAQARRLAPYRTGTRRPMARSPSKVGAPRAARAVGTGDEPEPDSDRAPVPSGHRLERRHRGRRLRHHHVWGEWQRLYTNISNSLDILLVEVRWANRSGTPTGGRLLPAADALGLLGVDGRVRAKAASLGRAHQVDAKSNRFLRLRAVRGGRPRGAAGAPSRRARRRSRRLPVEPMTRWHGSTIGIGFRFITVPTARAARGAPTGRRACRRSSCGRRERGRARPAPRRRTAPRREVDVEREVAARSPSKYSSS